VTLSPNLARVDIAAVTAAVHPAAAEKKLITETDESSGSLSSVRARTPGRGCPARRGSEVQAPSTTEQAEAYGFPGCSALPQSHPRQTYHPGAQRQCPVENVAVAYAHGRARRCTAIRRQGHKSARASGMSKRLRWAGY
jgi:hypothetical protein